MSNLAGLFPFARNTVLRAGAGTGKTEALATVYLHLVAGLADTETWPRAGLATERLVALTFTEKAATEMRERIAESVALLAAEALPAELGSDDPARRRRAAQSFCAERRLGPSVVARLTALAGSAVAQGRALPPPEAFRRVGFALGSARIGTFHSFAASVLRGADVARELGIDANFRVLEQAEADTLLRECVVRALSEGARSDVASIADLMATSGGIDAEGEHGLVARMVEMLRVLDEAGAGDDPPEVCAAIEASPAPPFMVHDAIERFARACQGVQALEDSGASQRMFRLADMVGSLGVVTTVEVARRIAVMLAAHPMPPATQARKVKDEYEDAQKALAALREGALSVLSYELGRTGARVIADARRRYGASKRTRHALDFADMMRNLRDAWRDHPALRRGWKNRVDAVLVDEFQDTNRVQRDLLYLLREERGSEREFEDGAVSLDAHALEPAGLLLVGDAKQSIYAFRGAQVRVFLETESDLCNAGGVSLELTDSHRALDTVLEAVNPATAALLGAGLTETAQVFYDRARDALTGGAQGDGRARCELLLVPPGRADDVRASEAEAIARRIRSLVDARPSRDRRWRPARYDDVAIVVPSWTHVEALRKALRAYDVPYALLGGPGFWERREVDDLVTLLRFASDSTDRLALAAVLRGPLVGLSDAGLARVLGTQGTADDALDPPANVRAGLDDDDRARLDEARPTLRRAASHGALLGPAALLRMVLEERNAAAVLAALPGGAQRVANVDKLVGLAEAAEQRGGDDASLPGFVRYVDRTRAAAQHETEAKVADVSAGAVRILSMHAAKGLEWPVVFVAQSSRRRKTHAERLVLDARGRLIALPAGFEAPDSFREARRDAHAAEEDDQRRLLYVALTRARDLLVVSGPADEGEGDWRSLSMALLREAPMRVRVVRASDPTPEALYVRERAATDERESEGLVDEDEDADAVPAPGAPHLAGPSTAQVAPARAVRRRLALAVDALQHFAQCPRRFHTRYELGIAEPVASVGGWEPSLRALLRALDPGAWSEGPEAFARACDEAAASLGDAHDEGSLACAVHWLRGAREGTALGLARAGAVLAHGVEHALSTGEGDDTVWLDACADLLVDARAAGAGEGMLALRVSASPVEADEHALALDVLRVALQRRAGGDARVRAAVLCPSEALTAEGPLPGFSLRFARDRAGESARSVEARLARGTAELAAGLQQARENAAWEARPRPACERLRCGFVLRCHAP